MGTVQVTYRITPDGADVDLGALKAAIGEIADIKDSREEPIAFGLKALIVTLHIPDAAGGTDDIENKLNALPQIGGIECVDLCRL